MGETQDKRFRCGIIYSGDSLGVNCFNCGFKSLWKVGNRLSPRMRQFMTGLGISSRRIKEIAYWADQMRYMIAGRTDVQERLKIVYEPDFPQDTLPISAKSLDDLAKDGCDDPDYFRIIEYLYEQRGEVAANASDYYWSPEYKDRLIIPCYHRNHLVGWIGRSIAETTEQRWIKQLPTNYIFNSQAMFVPHRKFLLVTEGTFDALVIDGIGALGGTLNDVQIAWIIQCGKEPIVVADRDKAGKKLVKIALEHEWAVATPHYGHNQWWDSDIKDADDAVRRYGKLYTLQSIFSTKTWNPVQIKQRTNYLLI